MRHIPDNKASFITVVSVCFLLSAFVFSSTAFAAGEVIAWGDNYFGECNVPEPNDSFKAVACGWWHSLGIKEDGSVVGWGESSHGECQVPEPNKDFVAVAAGGVFSTGLKSDGSIVAWGGNGHGECNLPAVTTGFTAIASGGYHSLGLKQDGSIVPWGYNGYGQCNVPEPNSGFVAVAAGQLHSLGLKADGSVVAWGFNSQGECNVPSPNSDFVAIAAGSSHSLGLKSDGSIVVWGYNGDGECNVPPPNTGFIAIASGSGASHSLGLKADGSIVAWGYNGDGECNIPIPNTAFAAIAVGGEHSLALKLNIIISKCTVTAGKTQGQDAFSASGTIEFPVALDFNDVNHIDVNIISLTDGKSVHSETVDCNVAKDRFKYTHKIPRSQPGAITSLTVDSKKHTFSINAQKVNLTGLTCPLRLDLTMSGPVTGDHTVSGDASESIVNGSKQPIPTRLMRLYKDTLIVTNAKVKNVAKPSSDSLSIKGDIAVADMNLDTNEPNLVTEEVVVTLSDVNDTNTQTFTIPPGSFKASKKGHLYNCNKINPVIAPVEDANTLVTASIDLDNCIFTVSIIKSDLKVTSGDGEFGLSFAAFNKTDNLW